MGNPMYRQIAETLREQIQSGDLQPGEQLKTELELREAFGASRNTVRDAIKLLTSLGLVETKPGQGTFVIKKTSPFVTTLSANRTGLGIEESVRKLSEVDKQNRKVTTSPVQVEIQEGTENVTAALRLPCAPRSSAVTRDGSSTAIRGRCRRRITRLSSRTAERSASEALATSTRAP